MKFTKRKIGLFILVIVMCFMFLTTDFSSILNNDIDSIEKIVTRNAGEGQLYATTEQALINKFITAMDTQKLIRVIRFDIPSTGRSSIILYGENNTKVASINDRRKFIEVNGKSYVKFGGNEEELKAFLKEFYSDQYRVNE